MSTVTTAANGKTNSNAAVKNNTAKSQTNQQTVIESKKPKQIGDFIASFLGLERLVNMRRKLQEHKDEISKITANDDESAAFELKHTYGLRIVIHDSNRHSYEIPNPALVEDVKNFLLQRIDKKVAEIDSEIINYNSTAA